MPNFAELRMSFEMENQADLYALARDFGNASRLMEQVNAMRKRALGHGGDPNELRECARAALGG